MSYTMGYMIKLGPVNSGLSLRSHIYNYDGTVIASGISTSFTELTDGDYYWYYPNFSDNLRGYIKIATSGGSYMTSFAVNPQDGEYLDEKLSQIVLTGQGTIVYNVYTKDTSGNVVGDSTVEVRASGQDSVIAIGFSNTSTGNVQLNLSSGIYNFSIYNHGVAFWNNPYYATVYASGTLYASGTRLTTPSYPQAGLTRIYAYVTDLGLDSQEDILFSIYPSGTYDVSTSGYLFTNKAMEARTNASGFAYFDLVPSNGTRVVVSSADYTKTFIVPTSGVHNLLTV